MNETLSLWQLVSNASLVVQAVMLILLLASLVSWVMIFQRGLDLAATRRQATDFENEFWSGQDLGGLYIALEQRSDQGVFGMESLFMAGFREFNRMRQQSVDTEVLMQNVHRAMRVAMTREEERLESHLAFLATVGSTSPYIGLFGTVWGIMNSFRGLANVNQVSLAVVAPGISEALIATAMGLLAAIPAVMAYNRYSAQAEVMVKRFEAFVDEFSGILHRNATTKD